MRTTFKHEVQYNSRKNKQKNKLFLFYYFCHSFHILACPDPVLLIWQQPLQVSIETFKHKISTLSFAIVSWNTIGFVLLQKIQQFWRTFSSQSWISKERFHIEWDAQSKEQWCKTCFSNVNCIGVVPPNTCSKNVQCQTATEHRFWQKSVYFRPMRYPLEIPIGCWKLLLDSIYCCTILNEKLNRKICIICQLLWWSKYKKSI